MERFDDALSEVEGMRADPREFLAQQFAVLNAIHPFMEGNGRTQREFWRQFSEEHGIVLDWRNATTAENHDAARRSMLGDLGPLRSLIAKVIVPDESSAQD